MVHPLPLGGDSSASVTQRALPAGAQAPGGRHPCWTGQSVEVREIGPPRPEIKAVGIGAHPTHKINKLQKHQLQLETNTARERKGFHTE